MCPQGLQGQWETDSGNVGPNNKENMIVKQTQLIKPRRLDKPDQVFLRPTDRKSSFEVFFDQRIHFGFVFIPRATQREMDPYPDILKEGNIPSKGFLWIISLDV